MKDMEKCLEINIQGLIDAGYINSKDDLTAKNLEELKKVINHAECESCIDQTSIQ